MNRNITDNDNGSGDARQDGNTPPVNKSHPGNLCPESNRAQAGAGAEQKSKERYFGGDGSLLPEHFDAINAKLAETAEHCRIDIKGLDFTAPLDERIRWAKANGWSIGGVYPRCSTTMQDSYSGQIDACIAHALQRRIITFPEYMAGDEGCSGRKANRPGIRRLKDWTVGNHVDVILAFSVNRLFRNMYKGLQFAIEDIVENDGRIVSVAENFDSNDKTWKDFLALNLLVAEKMVAAQPTFVRMGQRKAFEQGFLIGACPVGYRPEAVSDAGFTKRGDLKTRPMTVPEVADLLCRHFGLIANGATISEGCRLWNREINTWPPELRKLAVDPRSQTGQMRVEAYRKLFNNERYLGIWRFGKLRNKWYSGKDATKQEPAPDDEVLTMHWEHLRIIPDELWFRVQKRLSGSKIGKHGPRTGKPQPLWKQLTSIFICGECGHVFHTYGGRYIGCPESRRDNCAGWGTVDPKEALLRIVDALQRQALSNKAFVDEVIQRAQAVDCEDDSEIVVKIAEVRKQIKRVENKRKLMEDSLGAEETGSELIDRYKEAGTEKAALAAELAHLEKRLADKPRPISSEEILSALGNLSQLLDDAVSGRLGLDAVPDAANVIRTLVGGKVVVRFDKAAGRRRAYGSGEFTPALENALRHHGNIDIDIDPETAATPIRVSFRELPRYERHSEEAYRLRTEDNLSFDEIGRRLDCGCGNAWSAYKFWFTSRGLEVPATDKKRKNK